MAIRGTLSRVIHEPDTRRKELLGQIEALTNTRVVAYIANPNASPNFIDHNDPIFFNDVLEDVGSSERLDLIIDSPGGEPNIAEKLAVMCREYCKEFRVIVPNSAKSAATMLALASDEIVMGYLSELGPIDPQIRVVTPQGQITYVPAQSMIDSIGRLSSALQQGIDARAIIALVQKIDPTLIDVAQKAIDFSRQFAENWLSKHMLKDDKEKAKAVAKAISDNRRWLSHGKRIGFRAARDLGLNVKFIPKSQNLWKLIWEYYGRALHHLNTAGTIKLFETRSLGVNFTMHAARTPAQALESELPT